MSRYIKRIVISYVNGFSKSMDAGNVQRVICSRKRPSVEQAWKNVGIQLSEVMKDYDKKNSISV